MSATGPTLVRSSVGQTVDSFVWVYMILSHSPIHVRFSCVFFTDGLGLEPQRQSACQQDAGKRLVFNLLRPDSIAWNCGRETGSFSPDSLWIFGSRLFLFFFTFPSLFRFLLPPPPSLSRSFPPPSLVLCFFMNLFFVFERSRSTFTWGTSVDWNCFRLCAFTSSVFILAPRCATKWVHLSPSKRYIIRGWCTWKDWLAGNVDFAATLYRPDYRHPLDYLHVFLHRKNLMYPRNFFERDSKKFEFELTGVLILDCSNVDFCSRLRKMRKMMR